jgi:predicted permease
LAVVLLFTAAVMVDTFQRLRTRDLGYRTDGVVSGRIDLTAPRYASADSRRVFVTQVLERVAGLPGVEAVGATTVNPLCCGNWGARAVPEGLVANTQNEAPIVQHFIVTPGYFETLERRVTEGRSFTPEDGPGSQPVVIVDRALASRYWPGESAVGKRIRRWSATGELPWMTIVGVVDTALEEGEYAEAWYLPHAQHADGPSATGIHLMARGASGAGLAASVRAAIADLDPGLAVFDVTTLDRLVAENLQQDRLGASVAAAFGAAGLLLAGLGLYGVLTFVVSGDRTEIAVRRALGASATQVTTLIVGRGLRLVGLGLVVGAAAALAVARELPRWFVEADPDLRLLGWAAAVLLAAALLSMAAPVRRALRLSPLDAMRA